MKKPTVLLLSGAALIAATVYFIFQPNGSGTTPTAPLHTMEAANLSFAVPADYTLASLQVGIADDVPYLEQARLLPTDDYKDEQDREAGELSPSWVVSVYDNPEEKLPEAWVVDNDQLSNYSLRLGDVGSRTLGTDIEALMYTIDGLYPAQMFVFTASGTIVVVYASYLDETSPTYTDLSSWLASFARGS